jgi:hypothetical protein
MAATVDLTIQEAQALLAAVNAHAAELADRGYRATRVAAFRAAIQSALSHDSRQKGAVATLNQRTEAQDAALKRAADLLTMVRNAAKAAFGRQKKVLKEFRVGLKRPKSVGEMSTVMEYMTEVVQEHSAELLENGMSKADMESLSTTYAELVTADAMQENAKKLRNGATETRDEALAALHDEIYRLRKFAQACFAKQPAILMEFTRIPQTGHRHTAVHAAKAAASGAAAGA